MQPKQNSTNVSSPLRDGREVRSERNVHYVFITDHSGIGPVFYDIKVKLTNETGCCLTLIYSIDWLLPEPLFHSELDMLGKRFPSRVMTFYLFDKVTSPPENSEMNQRMLEMVINCNTGELMQFLISGEEELVEKVADRLCFLGIGTNHIRSQIIK